MKDPIEYLNDAIGYLDHDLQEVCVQVLMNRRFRAGYGSDTKHHNYKGGLLQHTAEVMSLVLAQVGSLVIDVNLNVLIPAVLFHDFMKIRDYDAEGNPTVYKDRIYHVAGSYARWVEWADGVIDPLIVDAVGHCILSHHGRREWKACVEPQTIEAQILHNADSLSAWYGKSKNGPQDN